MPFVPKYSMSCMVHGQLDLIFVASVNGTGTTKNYVTKLFNNDSFRK